MSDVTHTPEAWAEDFGIWEKAVSWVPSSERERVEIQTWARPDEFVRYRRRTWFGGDVKAVSIERLCVSLLMSNNLQLKGNKVSYLNRFRVFRVSDSLCLFHTSVSWVCYTSCSSPFFTLGQDPTTCLFSRFLFILWSAGTVKSTRWPAHFFLWINTRTGFSIGNWTMCS